MAFATTSDVATRLARSLTSDEEGLADLLIESATAVIAVEAGKTWEWAENLPDPVHPLLRAVCLEVVVRVMQNPDQLHSFSEQLGAHQQSKGFRRAAEGGGLTLDDRECRLVRFAIHGRLSGSARARSLADDLAGDCTDAEVGS